PEQAFNINLYLQGFIGNIELATPRSQVTNDLLQNRPLLYRLRFPYWAKIPPAITQISVNENQICFGYPIDRSLVPVVTGIDLQHTLTVGTLQNIGSPGNAGSLPDFVNPRTGVSVNTGTGGFLQTPSNNFNTQSTGDLQNIPFYNNVPQNSFRPAGHCIKGKAREVISQEVWMILGRDNLEEWSNEDGSQTIQAKSIRVHSDYVPNKSDADVAIIILKKEVTISSTIKPACLWDGEKNVKQIVGKKGTVAGWGRDESGKVYSREAKQFDLPVVSQEDCLRSNKAYLNITSDRTFCAGYKNNTGPCNGDSGSGFLMRVNGRWTVRGVVSISLLNELDRSCDLEQYVVYTDVAQFIDWVWSILK
ncbi:hypothetical protein ILUMI_03667, partial [Ignelater luminosus]